MPQEGHTKEEEPKELHDSKEPHAEESKIKEPIAKVVVYCHPHHPEKQQSSRKVMSINKHTMDQPTARKALNIEVYGGLRAMNGEVRVAQQQYETIGATKVEIKVARK
jgi:hypothetical protein